MLGLVPLRMRNSETRARLPHGYIHGVQRRMISVVIFFRIFEIIIFCVVVSICDLVHAVEAMYGLP